jgi:hypothetical protein
MLGVRLTSLLVDRAWCCDEVAVAGVVIGNRNALREDVIFGMVVPVEEALALRRLDAYAR